MLMMDLGTSHPHCWGRLGSPVLLQPLITAQLYFWWEEVSVWVSPALCCWPHDKPLPFLPGPALSSLSTADSCCARSAFQHVTQHNTLAPHPSPKLGNNLQCCRLGAQTLTGQVEPDGRLPGMACYHSCRL